MLQKDCEYREDRAEESLGNEVLETGVWLTESRNGWNMRTLETEMGDKSWKKGLMCSFPSASLL